jgi:hypothetical protein
MSDAASAGGVSAVEKVQEQFFPEIQEAWGEARPGCPGDPNPAQAIEHDGDAWWVCPIGGCPIARIEHLD